MSCALPLLLLLLQEVLCLHVPRLLRAGGKTASLLLQRLLSGVVRSPCVSQPQRAAMRPLRPGLTDTGGPCRDTGERVVPLPRF